jgi:hypothetical protein
MTWIVGYSSPLGYAVGISDIRVTFRGNRTKDCLQKIHPISPNICLGFAGSVRIGFSLVERLRYELRNTPPGSAWDQYEVAKWCPGVFEESLMRLEPMGLGMGSFGLEMSISDILRKQPISDISPHVQICLVRRGEYFLSDNNLVQYAPDGAEIPSPMPPVATSFAEFERMAGAEGISPVCAVC